MPRATRTLLGGSRIPSILILIHAFAPLGCSLDEGGIGGSPGPGGVGGAPPLETSMLRVAHLAVGVPALDATELDFTVTDQGSFNGISFGRATPPATLPSDIHQLSVTEPGGVESLADATWELEADVRYTVVAYRKPEATGALGLFVFDEGIDDLEMGHGRVLIGNAADDSTWAMVHVVDSGTGEVVAPSLAPGDQSEPIDLEAGQYELGLSISSAPPAIDLGPFLVDVAADETTILILVDGDVTDGAVEAAVHVLESTTAGMIPAIPLG